MRRFSVSLAEIQSATNNFDKSLVIRDDELSLVYRVDRGLESVEISRLLVSLRRDIKAFFSEVRHRNIVSLIGYCREKNENILVHESMPSGTLAEHLRFKTQPPLEWGQRLRICIGAARGLDYLHTGTNIANGLKHGHVTSANILLDENWEAKLWGFGSSIEGLFADGYSKLAGTSVYTDPHYRVTEIYTRNSDVYSFGVVLFEVLSGMSAVGLEQEQNLVEWAKRALGEGKVYEIVDPFLQEARCLEEFANLACQCLHIDPLKRPRMIKVVSRLERLLKADQDWDEEDIGTADVGRSSESQEDSGYPIIEEDHPSGAWDQELDTSVSTKVVDAIASTTHSDTKSAGKSTFRRKIWRYLGIPNVVSANPGSRLKTKATSGRNRGQRGPKFTIFSADQPSLQIFSFAEIKSATHKFAVNSRVGRGGYGDVYRGSIFDGSISRQVAIKRWASSSSQGTAQFKAEVEVHSKIRHKHVASLIGYCNDGDEMILVYEYLPRGNLGEHLYGGGFPLSWTQRLKICIGIARALDYLHTCSPIQNAVIHRDIKSANILLDEKWEAKISDFAVCRIVHANESPSVVITEVMGTLGYLDPEYFEKGIMTTKSDVYSFGVVLCELLCGKKAIDFRHSDEPSLVRLFTLYVEEKRILDEIIDPKLCGQIPLKCLDAFAQIIAQCLLYTSRDRPTMAEVVARLELLLQSQQRTDSSRAEGETVTFGSYEIEDSSVSKGGNKEEVISYSSDIEVISVSSDGNIEHHEEIGPFQKSTSDLSGYSSSFVKKTERRRMQEIRLGFTDVLTGTQAEKLPSARSHHKKVSLRIKKKSTDLRLLDYMGQADILTRRKDFLYLILFYPMKIEAGVNFQSVLDKCSSLNKYIRKSLDSSRNYQMEIHTLLEDVEEHLADAAFDMVAYLPEDLVMDNRWESLLKSEETPAKTLATEESSLSDILEIHAGAIASAALQALLCIKAMNIKKLGISGRGAEEVTETLKHKPELIRVFEIVLSVCVKKHTSITELTDDIEEQLMNWWKKRILGIGKQTDVFDRRLNCLLFLDCKDGSIDFDEVELCFSNRFQTLQMVLTSGPRNGVDLEITTQDHLLPWNLFYKNADLETMGNYSHLQKIALDLVHGCHGHLLAIILLARALRSVRDVGVWSFALHVLASSLELGGISEVMVGVLRFIWPRKDTVSQKCIIQCALSYKGSEVEKSSLISGWIGARLVETEQDGEHALEDLISSFFLEKFGENCVRMRDETRVVLLTHFVPRAHALFLKQDGSESKELPKVEEWDAREIQLSNVLSELPENPSCPVLVNLFLQSNQDLMDIPITFFDRMPGLQALDLSRTSIKHLPASISKLTSLRQLFIRDCDLLMELPPEIGELKNLKVFDSEGTQLVCLPVQFGSLAKLECLTLSLYHCAEGYKESNQNLQIFPADALSKLPRLRELSIHVDLYDNEWWDDESDLVIEILSELRDLETLELYFPTTDLLHVFLEKRNWEGVPVYLRLLDFSFIVGRRQQCLISRLPPGLDETFLKLPKCLKYTNSEGDTNVIAKALKHANAMFLDRHWTLQSLSTFEVEEMEKLKVCLLAECNEMRELVDGSHFYEEQGNENEGFLTRPVLGSLEYLSIHHMKSLSCIWRGPIHRGCLSNLKTLTMHSCPELTTILTPGLLDCLTLLEFLVVENCTQVSSVVSPGSYPLGSAEFLPNLKKLSLVNLPELVSISGPVTIGPRLESLVVYDCPNLEKFSFMEVSDGIKEIKGENEWWDALQWCPPEWTSGRPDYLDGVFIPLGRDGDIMDELADAVNFLPRLVD